MKKNAELKREAAKEKQKADSAVLSKDKNVNPPSNIDIAENSKNLYGSEFPVKVNPTSSDSLESRSSTPGPKMFTRTVVSCNPQTLARSCNSCMQPVITFSNSLFCNGLMQRLDNCQITTRTVATDQTDDTIGRDHSSNVKITGRKHNDSKAAPKGKLPVQGKPASRKYRVSCQRFYIDDFRRRDVGSISQRRRELVFRQSNEMLNELENLRVHCESLVQQHPDANLVELEDLNSEARAIVDICKELNQQHESDKMPEHVKNSSHLGNSAIKQDKQKKQQHTLKRQCKALAKTKSLQWKNAVASGEEQLEQKVKELAQYKESGQSAKQQTQSKNQIDRNMDDIFDHLHQFRLEREQFVRQHEVLKRLEELKHQCRNLAYMAKR
ncbi:hypothetical protein AWZ03_008478 [Drosophila navojoa]|uniref:Uncharacterized protein n=1 Tax=Drosophila navojoa TaxID=7232 RepID=A0A484B8D8_DRONA|nr:hypothetical protein AWZ03_008478 [Drosophila navojoa]